MCYLTNLSLSGKRENTSKTTEYSNKNHQQLLDRPILIKLKQLIHIKNLIGIIRCCMPQGNYYEINILRKD